MTFSEESWIIEPFSGFQIIDLDAKSRVTRPV